MGAATRVARAMAIARVDDDRRHLGPLPGGHGAVPAHRRRSAQASLPRSLRRHRRLLPHVPPSRCQLQQGTGTEPCCWPSPPPPSRRRPGRRGSAASMSISRKVGSVTVSRF